MLRDITIYRSFQSRLDDDVYLFRDGRHFADVV